MRFSIRTAAVAAALLALAGGPAHADQVGGGVVLPGAAHVGGSGTGVQQNPDGTKRHVLTAECTYDTVSGSGGSGVQGNLYGSAHATGGTAYNPTTTLTFRCWLDAVGTYEIADEQTRAGNEVSSSAGKPVPASFSSIHLCVSATARWTFGSDEDTASYSECTNGGLTAHLNDIKVELAQPAPLGSVDDLISGAEGVVCPVVDQALSSGC